MTSSRNQRVPLVYQDFNLLLFDYDQPTGKYRVWVQGEAPSGGSMRIEDSAEVTYHPGEIWGQMRSGAPKLLTRLANRKLNEQDCYSLGWKLADLALPAGRVRDLFIDSIEGVQPGYGVRLRLQIEAEALRILPWEFMCLPQASGEGGASDFLCLRREYSIVRTDPVEWARPKLETVKTIRVTGLSANPTSESLDLEGERKAVEAAIALQRNATSRWGERPGTSKALVDLLREGAEIFHFGGHASFSTVDNIGRLLLEDEHHQQESYPSVQLALLLRNANVRLAVLSGCETGSQGLMNHWGGIGPALTREQIPAVIANQYRIRDDSAVKMAEYLYPRLMQGFSVDEALFEVRNAIVNTSMEGIAARDWGTPVLYMRPGIGVLFPREDAEEQRKAGERGQIVSSVNVPDNKGVVNGVYIENYYENGSIEKRWVPLDILDRAEHFRGREKEKAMLKGTLKPGEMATIVAAGGMGKSALAAQVVWELTKELREPPEEFPDGVVAYTFYGGGSTSGAFTHIASSFGIETGEKEKTPAQAARQALDGVTLLLVLDGTEALREKNGAIGRLEEVLAIRGRSGILITSRDRRDARGEIFELEPLDEDPAISIVMAHGGKYANDRDAVFSICDLIGRLPLALRLAGSYLSANQIYARELIKRLPDKLWEDLSIEERQHESVLVLMESSLEKLSLEAREALGAASLLALAPFSSEVIAKGLLKDRENDTEINKNQFYRKLGNVKDAMSELGRYGLVKRVGEEWRLSHALIRTYANEIGLAPEGVMDQLAEAYLELSLEAINKGYPNAFVGQRGHVRALAELLEKKGLESAGTLWNYLGRHMYMSGDYVTSQELLMRALDLDETRYGPNHPLVARDLNNLGTVLQELGDLDEAQKKFERALTIDEAVYGPDHPNIAEYLNNLGMVRKAQGDLLGAHEMINRALQIDEVFYGLDHPNVAGKVSSLGMVLQEQGELAGSREMLERALRIDKLTYGSEHPKVATDMANLGKVMQEQGDLVGAKKHYQKSLRIDETTYGLKHPKVARDLNNLAMVRKEQGDLAEAQKFLERALNIDEEAYGPEHSNVAIRVNNLGMILKDKGELSGARNMLVRALRIWRKVYGMDNPQVANGMNNLGEVRREMGDLAGAQKMYARALRIWKNIYGEEHPQIAIGLNNMGLVLQDQSDLIRAQENFNLALNILKKYLPKGHITIEKVKGNLEAVNRVIEDQNQEKRG